MPEKFKDKINVPISIPTWQVVSILLIGFFSAGITIQKLNALLAAFEKTEGRVDVIYERQLTGLATLNSHGIDITDLKGRMVQVERNTFVYGTGK